MVSPLPIYKRADLLLGSNDGSPLGPVTPHCRFRFSGCGSEFPVGVVLLFHREERPVREYPIHSANQDPVFRREAMEELREIRIRDGYREELQAIHQILFDEYDFDEQYYPISLQFMHNSFEVEYADDRKQGRRETSRDELLSLVDSRISETLGRIAAYAWLGAIGTFVVRIVIAVS